MPPPLMWWCMVVAGQRSTLTFGAKSLVSWCKITFGKTSHTFWVCGVTWSAIMAIHARVGLKASPRRRRHSGPCAFSRATPVRTEAINWWQRSRNELITRQISLPSKGRVYCSMKKKGDTTITWWRHMVRSRDTSGTSAWIISNTQRNFFNLTKSKVIL